MAFPGGIYRGPRAKVKTFTELGIASTLDADAVHFRSCDSGRRRKVCVHVQGPDGGFQ